MQEEESHEFSGYVFASFCMLLIHVASGPLFHRFKFHYLHESGISMIIGFSLALMVRLIAGSFKGSIDFSREIFFNVVLPPIIFNAGYTMKKQTFFKFSPYIITCGIFSTIASFFVVMSITYWLNESEMFTLTSVESKPLLKFSTTEIILFSIIICATDSVAALTFIDDANEPKLHAILFGEGVMNDAVCIVLYKIISEGGKSSNIDFDDIIHIIGTFFSTFFFSVCLGVLFGALLCLFLKVFRRLNPHKEQEIMCIFIFAMISYSFTELIGQSPILALLFTGIIASHYGYYNLDFQSSQESMLFVKKHVF